MKYNNNCVQLVLVDKIRPLSIGPYFQLSGRRNTPTIIQLKRYYKPISIPPPTESGDDTEKQSASFVERLRSLFGAAAVVRPPRIQQSRLFAVGKPTLAVFFLLLFNLRLNYCELTTPRWLFRRHLLRPRSIFQPNVLAR